MDTQSQLPITEAKFYILLSLTNEPKYGYAIMRDMSCLSDIQVKSSTSTLYGSDKRFLQHGWIERYIELIAIQDGHKRKAYQLSDLGPLIPKTETT